MAASDYASVANQLAAQKSKANDDENNQLFRALLSQRNERGMQQAAGQQHMAAQAAGAEQAKDLARYKDQLGQEGVARNVDTLEGLAQKHPGMGGAIGENGNVSLTRPTPDPMQGIAAEKLKEHQLESLSKRYQKVVPTYNNMKELEDQTDTGKGGVLTSKDAHLKSYGPYASYLPNSMVGIAETLGVLPKGSQQERAAVQSWLNDYAHEKYGARVTPQQYEREVAAHGLNGSGDPKVAEKAMRQRASDMMSAQKAIEGGYSQDVRDQFHADAPNPLEGVNVYKDSQPKLSPRQMLEHLRKTQGGT